MAATLGAPWGLAIYYVVSRPRTITAETRLVADFHTMASVAAYLLLLSTVVLRCRGRGVAVSIPFAVMWALALTLSILQVHQYSGRDVCGDIDLCMPDFGLFLTAMPFAVMISIAVAGSAITNHLLRGDATSRGDEQTPDEPSIYRTPSGPQLFDNTASDPSSTAPTPGWDTHNLRQDFGNEMSPGTPHQIPPLSDSDAQMQPEPMPSLWWGVLAGVPVGVLCGLLWWVLPETFNIPRFTEERPSLPLSTWLLWTAIAITPIIIVAITSALTRKYWRQAVSSLTTALPIMFFLISF
ncbi:hypothetical protein [Williamsia sterculiae]|uniref:hypothetical protein n=1 Tax=Williamsia sterculiae TaxID=1344003 RepID=UPI00190EADA1|nr:hypothetical protein [Williamsia sterculiae]